LLCNACLTNGIYNGGPFVGETEPALSAHFTHHHYPKVDETDVEHRIFYIRRELLLQLLDELRFGEAGRLYFSNHWQGDVAIIIYEVPNGTGLRGSAATSTTTQQVEYLRLCLIERSTAHIDDELVVFLNDRLFEVEHDLVQRVDVFFEEAVVHHGFFRGPAGSHGQRQKQEEYGAALAAYRCYQPVAHKMQIVQWHCHSRKLRNALQPAAVYFGPQAVANTLDAHSYPAVVNFFYYGSGTHHEARLNLYPLAGCQYWQGFYIVVFV